MDIYDDICHAFDRRTRSAKLTEGLSNLLFAPAKSFLTSYLLLLTFYFNNGSRFREPLCEIISFS